MRSHRWQCATTSPITARSSDGRRLIEPQRRTRLPSQRPRVPSNYRPFLRAKPCCHPEHHPNRLSLKVRMPSQGILDLLLDVRWMNRLRLDRDAVADTSDTEQFPNGILGRLLLILPVDLAPQGHPSLLHGDLDRLLRNHGVPPEHGEHAFGDFVVCCFLFARVANLDLLRNGTHASNPSGRRFGSDFFRVARYVSTQGHHALIDGNSDVCRIDARVEVEFLEHVVSYQLIIHGASPLLCIENERLTKPTALT